jgi:hypothetical protein
VGRRAAWRPGFGEHGGHAVGVAATPLSADEAAGLSFMREEEKLARDAHAALYAQWRLTTSTTSQPANSPTWTRSCCCSSAMACPTRPPPPRPVFGNPVLQGLYGALVATGQTSPVAALQVGAEIEELDIHDLRTLKTQVDNADLTLVYENLEQGSRNHLRAFHTNLLRQVASYTPKHITQVEYDAIVLSAREIGML